MNPSAAAYVPSGAIADLLARREPTPPVSPPLFSKSSGASCSQVFSPAVTPVTPAERLQNSRGKSALQTNLLTKTPASTSTVRTCFSSNSARSTYTAKRSPIPPLSPDLTNVFIRYSKQQLLSLRPAAIEHVMRGRIVDYPPFLKIPESFALLLGLPFSMEYVNVDAAMQLVKDRQCASLPATSSSTRVARDKDVATEAQARRFACPVCAHGGPEPCIAVQQIIQRASRQVMSTRFGAAVMQPSVVVASLLRLALVFEAKQSSLRLRMLAEQSPRVVNLVEAYLCGEGYHLPLPPVTAHKDWAALNSLLKFDFIRDNKTRIITDLSKHWRKRRTQFEQFVHFFFFRDARPVRPAKNIITQSVKPGMVAMLSGDVTAMVLLHRLDFFIPPDYYWSVFPFLRQALGEGTLAYNAVRHLGLYLSASQPVDMYNPVERPSHV